MNKKYLRLTEQDLHRIITESVNKVLIEDKVATIDDYDDFDTINHYYCDNHDMKDFHNWLDDIGRMPEGYDDNIKDPLALKRLGNMNHNYETEYNPFKKDAEEKTSWYNLDNHQVLPNGTNPDYHRNDLFNNDTRRYAKWYVNGELDNNGHRKRP